MIRLFGRSVTALFILALAGAIGLYAAVPYLERSMAFFPEKHDGRVPWHLPVGAADVFFDTSDGVRLHGWVFTAPTRNGLTVLLLHGNAGNVRSFTTEAQTLQARGFDVFAIDYRGYGRSEGETLGEDTLRLDGMAALSYLTHDRRLDPTTIALFGYSLGTTVATDLAVSSPCRAVALVAPLASARRQAEIAAALVPTPFLSNMRNRFDTVGKIGKARCPVLVIHGTDDEVIPIAQGQAVHAAAPEPKRFVAIPRGRHWLPGSSGRGYLGEVTSFFLDPR
jgi:uncharacterized protein